MPPLVAQISPPLHPPVVQVDGSVEPLLKSQPVRPQIRPDQFSGTLNDSDEPDAASQPVACEGAVPLDVKSAGQMVEGHELTTVKVRAVAQVNRAARGKRRIATKPRRASRGRETAQLSASELAAVTVPVPIGR